MNIIKLLWLLPIAYCSLLQGTEILPMQTHRVFQFENEHVRVWKTVLMPHQPLKMHRHDCARVVVGLKGGTLTKIDETGEISPLIFETGVAHWLKEDPPETLHGDINESEEPIEVMVIEVKSLDTSLSTKKCIPCSGGIPPLKGEALTTLHSHLDQNWKIIDEHHLEKEFLFKNFQEALAFTNKLGEIAEQEDHHPEIVLSYGKVIVRLWTHKIDGLSESDFILASKYDWDHSRCSDF